MTNDEARMTNDEWTTMIQEVKRQFPKAIFWRIEPPDSRLQLTAYSLQLRRAPRAVQPATTLIIDLSKNEDELLSQMKQKTRYNIKVAQRHGVAVRQMTNYQLPITNAFLDLLEETAKRDEFRIHSREYYKKLLTLTPTLSQQERESSDDSPRPSDEKDSNASPRPHGERDGACPALDAGVRGFTIELFCAFHDGKLLAGESIAFFSQWAYYLHGASSSEHRELMAPHLLHWEIMREAKRRGCTKYDLWGVVGNGPRLRSGKNALQTTNYKLPDHSWSGITKFKTGFAPDVPLTYYPGTFDVVLRPWEYKLYRLAQRLLG